jgi:hypothetical protein
MNSKHFCTGDGCPIKVNCLLYTSQPIGVEKFKVFTEIPGRLINLSEDNKSWVCDKLIENKTKD